MKRWTMKHVLILISIFISSISYAQTEQIVTLKKGEAAPFDGSLLNSLASAKIIVNQDNLKKQCELDKNYELQKSKELCNVNISSLKIDLDISNKKYNEITKLKDAENQRLTQLLIKSESKDYSKWWYVGGIVTGLATSILTYFAISSISK